MRNTGEPGALDQNRMKVLHVVPTYWPATRYGGPVYSVHELCAALADRGLDVSVFTTSVDGPGDSGVEHGSRYDRDGVGVYYFRSRLFRKIYYSGPLLKSLRERAGEYDLLHLHSIFLFPTNAAARVAARRGIPYVLSPRGMLDKPMIQKTSTLAKNTWLRLVETKTIEQASLLHLTSSHELRELRRFGYKFPSVAVIPNGVNLPEPGAGARTGTSSGSFRILFLGRLSVKKRVHRIIEALPLLDFSATLVIAGPDEKGYRATLERRLLELSIKDLPGISVCFTGPVERDRRNDMYREADVMVLPSMSENFGNTVIEAMALGCPVIVSTQVGASEIVSRAGAGLLTDGTAADIALQLKRVHASPENARQMGMHGIAEVTENYQWTGIAESMINAYQRVLESCD